ncbi:hypothetical protein Bca4012_059232 [Brassica carinata]
MKVHFFLILVLNLSSKYDSKIVSTEPFKISARRNILSPEKVFVFGFFKPSTTSGVADRWYLGIWHHRFPQEVVWVANRDNPMSKPVGTLKILDTNLVLLDQHGTRVWWTNRTSTNLIKSLVTGELLDSGNLVLRYFNNDSSTGCLWQSFDFPTDALVSDMKLGWDAKSNINRVLKSWRSSDDPSSGEITYGVERHELVQSIIRKKGMPTFRSGPWKITNESGNFTYVTYNITATKEEAIYFFTITNKTFFSILRLSVGGLLNRSTWIPKPQQVWQRVESILPHDACGLYNKCGPNGICDTSRLPNCDCIHGFEPRDQEAWGFQDWTGGCVRKTQLNCSGDGFEKFRKMMLPDITKSIVDMNIGLKECKEKCNRNCNCTAFANLDMQNSCVIWVGEILDLRKSMIAGQDLFIRLAATDIYKKIWKLWLEGKGLDIVDPVIVDSSSTFRPSEIEMNQPERPGSFVTRNRFVIGSSSSNQPNKEACSRFRITDWTSISAR